MLAENQSPPGKENKWPEAQRTVISLRDSHGASVSKLNPRNLASSCYNLLLVRTLLGQSIISSACYIRSIAIYLLFLCNSAESVCGSHLVLLIFLFHLAAYSSPTALPVSHLYFVLCRVMLPVLLSKWD